jgi:hypothetical protein
VLKSVKNQGDYSQFKISGIFFEKNGLYFVTTVQGVGYLSGVTKKFSGKKFYGKNMNETK